MERLFGARVRLAIAAAILLVAALFAPRLSGPARTASLQRAIDAVFDELEQRIEAERPDLALPVPVRLFPEDAAAAMLVEPARERVLASPHLSLSARGFRIRLLYADVPEGMRIGLAFDETSIQPIEIDRTIPPVRTWAIFPPLVAIVLAFATRRVVLSLGVAIALGALLSATFDPLEAIVRATRDYAWESILSRPSKLWIVVFTVVLGGMVGVTARAGDIQAIVDRLTRWVRGPKSAQLAAFVAGLVTFFDDYTNAVLVGNAMRPLFDRLRISREKLAYLVDSTSAPIAGLALISTWIGYEVSLFGDAARALGLSASGYEIFIRALPFRFYCVFALVFVLVNVLGGRDFGSMLRAERRAAETGQLLRPGAVPLSGTTIASLRPREGVEGRPLCAIAPVAVVLVATIVGLVWDGGGFSGGHGSLLSLAAWREILGAADSIRVLGIASLLGVATALALALGPKRLRLREALVALGLGARSMGLAVLVLLLAWGLEAVTRDLGTTDLMVATLSGAIPAAALPAAVFVTAAVVAFSTGTSWGTMAILIPTVLPLAFHAGGMPLLLVCAAAVLDGGIFGDHISPISDTTVLSSISSGSDLMDHVRTQMPYALTAMVAALVFGYGLAGIGLPSWLSWVLGPAMIAAVLFGLGRSARPAEAPVATAETAPGA